MSLATMFARALLGTAAIAVAAPTFGQEAEVTAADASTPAPDAGQLVAAAASPAQESELVAAAAPGDATPIAAAALDAARQPPAELVVTARRREERAQDVPIPVSVLAGDLLADTGAFNVNRLTNLVPSLQFYSTNPRNTAVNIRGLGQPYGLTNDGIEPGVGFYVDGVLYARPASTTLDFIDVERVEVLRGPQGTLFGKNTTAGAIVITTRKPSFETGLDAELSVGDYNFTQAKASLTGAITDKIAGRLSFSSTRRDGNITNVVSQEEINDLNNLGLRGQLLYQPNDVTEVILAADFTRQRPRGYAQVLAGAVPTQRPANRQFWEIIEDLNYVPANADAATRTIRPFDRVVDTLTPWRSGNDVGGVSLNVDTELGSGTFTSTTAWRFWDWDPSNDRDYLRLEVATLSQAPSTHDQWSQEFRWTGDLTSKVSAVMGVYAFSQKLKTNPVHTEEVGADYFRFIWNPNSGPNGSPDITLWGPGGSVVDNYYAGQRSEITSTLDTTSAALFGQLDWAITDKLHLLPGVRFNYDDKQVDFEQRVLNVPELPPGSPTPPAPAYSNQTAVRDEDDTNFSAQLTLAYRASDAINYYATYAETFKTIGVNLGGGPAIEIPPEDVEHIEVGLKSSPLPGVTANLTAFNTEVKDYQTQVLVPNNPRPVIASAEKIRVRGVEFDGNAAIGDAVSLYGSVAYTDGEYVSFENAPLPLELTGQAVPFVDASGGRLPGLSKWAASLGGEYRIPVTFLGTEGEFFTAADLSWRDDFSSSATPSRFLNVDAYTLVNLRLGFRADNGWSTQLWVRNAFDEEYFELLQAAPGGQGAGHYGAQLGDPRTYGVTVRYGF